MPLGRGRKGSAGQLRQKTRQIISMMMHVIDISGFGVDVDSAHSQSVRDHQIPDLVLKHG